MIIDWQNKAIRSLVPNAQFSVNSEGIHWNTAENGGVACPTTAEIDAEIIVLQAEYDSQEYARNRKAEYPTIQECVHAILDDDLTALQVLRQAVKDKYPK